MTGFVVHFVYLRAQNQFPMPARCPECGSFVKKDAKSCPRCGAGLSAIPFTEPKEEAESPHQDTDDYPRLVQEFTAYYNKYQQLRQKAMQQPQKFDKHLKRYLKIRHATPTPPDTPWLGRFRIYRDYRCVFRVSFKKECILVEWPSQKKNRPRRSNARAGGMSKNRATSGINCATA